LWGVQDQNGTASGPVISFLERLLARQRAMSEIAQQTSTTTYSVTFYENGIPLGSEWSVILNGQKQTIINWACVNNGRVITFNNLKPGTYSYTVPQQPPYYPNPASGSVTVSDSNPNPIVHITFSQSGETPPQPVYVPPPPTVISPPGD